MKAPGVVTSWSLGSSKNATMHSLTPNFQVRLALELFSGPPSVWVSESASSHEIKDNWWTITGRKKQN